MSYNLISGDTVKMGHCVSVSLYLYKKLSNYEKGNQENTQEIGGHLHLYDDL